MFDRNALLAHITRIAIKPVDLGDGLAVCVKELMAETVEEILEHKGVAQQAHAVIASVCQPDGSPVFTDADLPALVKGGFRKLKFLSDAVADVNGFSEKKSESGTSESEATAASS